MRAIGLSFAALLLTPTCAARAQLAPAFVGKISLESSYVTGAPGATDVAFSGDGRAVVTTKSGVVLVRRANGTLVSVPYPFGGTLDTGSEKGLLGVVADPNVAQNRAFYFYVSNGPTSDKHRVYRAVLNLDDTLSVDALPIVGAARGMGPGLEGPANHDGGGLVIHAGKLYVGVGDTGANGTPPRNKYGSCLNKGNGKILRVNLDGSVPNDNPLVGLSAVSACNSVRGPWLTAAPDTRIFAWGLRNPWRLWLDPQTARLWIGDVGEVTSEEISVGFGDQHYGYPFVEGTEVWGDVDGMNCATLVPSRSCTPPAYGYGRAVGQSVTGGLIPEGCGWSHVFAQPNYVFGDASAGFVRALPVNAARSGFSSTTPVDFASLGSSVSFRMGPDGSLYVVLFGAGAVYRFTPIDRSGPGCVAPVPASSGAWIGALFSLLVLCAGWVWMRRGASKAPSA